MGFQAAAPQLLAQGRQVVSQFDPGKSLLNFFLHPGPIPR
jgi:hypothetical protein